MARIRTIKPEFFRHEGLQDLAAKHGAHVMLVFAGLWGHADRAGQFEWRPRQLKLDILPFLDFDMGTTLDILAEAGFIERYEVDGKSYGLIPSFADHQRFSGKEAQEKVKHPAPPAKKVGSVGEAPEKHVPVQEEEGNGIREGKGKGERASAPLSPNASPSSSKPNVAKREHWPEGGIVPEPWLRGAEAERRRLGLPPVDMAVVGVKFANFHIAKANQPRTQTEWQAAFNNFALDEKIGKSNGSPASGQHGQPSRVTRIVGEFIAESRARSEAGSG